MFSLIYGWINTWVNNREAGDLRRHRGHYDVIVMVCSIGLHWVDMLVNHMSPKVTQISSKPPHANLWSIAVMVLNQMMFGIHYPIIICAVLACLVLLWLCHFNSSPPGQNGSHFGRLFFNEHGRVQIQISLKCVPRSSIDSKAVLVQVMAWCRTGDKPLPEPMLTQFTDAYMRH